VTLTTGQIFLFLLVLTRMAGAILFNPLLGRRSVPAILKMGLALLVTILVFPTITATPPTYETTISFMLAVAWEMLVGYAIGLIMDLFISWVLMAGEIMDMEMGLSVSKIYDPQSGISMPVSGSVFNVFLTLIFFISNGHLTFIRILAVSMQVFPPGTGNVGYEIGNLLVTMLYDTMLLSLKLGMPVLVIELLSEAGLGTLMRMVPQINVFSVGLQLKLIVGLLVVILALPAAARLMDTSLTQFFDQMQKGIAAMLSAG
jgi:flagellar biosynthetic protein FliR